MPVPIPTPDEARRMSWRQRSKALTLARKALDALEAECELDGPAPRPVVVGRAANTAEAARSQGKATPPPPSDAKYLEAYGAVVRGQAKALLAAMPPDPDAELHARALYFAVRRT